MIYKEEIRDLFSVPEEYFLAHCISADFGMGKGIVIEFNKRFDMKRKLKSKYPDYLDKWVLGSQKFDCIMEGKVFNLITKERYFHKPTYDSLSGAVILMRNLALKNNISKIAMPVIGCGLDRLCWDKVSKIIKIVFEDTDVEVLVCKQ